jgi:hypothetical protein
VHIEYVAPPPMIEGVSGAGASPTFWSHGDPARLLKIGPNRRKNQKNQKNYH